jgi:hypothetical protein
MEGTNRNWKKGVLLGAGLCTAAGMGAGLMYLLDPTRGRARRSSIRDKCFSMVRHSLKEIDHKLTDVEHRAKGVLAEARSLLNNSVDIPDPKLEARVRTRLGRSVGHPHDVHVTALEGTVVLTGGVSARDAKRAEIAAKLTPGVKSVENLLELT